jgi:1-deoxy-D-xylulose-5-phosphate synthase
MRLIDDLSLPESVSALDARQLEQLAREIRQEIIDTISECGGHLGASLGAVEIAIALHAELESPRDHIIWDVGHQAYAHKILTGRLAEFRNVRRFGSISGFPKRSESDHDCFGVGHASTSVSAAVGFAEAARLRGDPHPPRVVAVIGDGALTGGLAYEGLNQAGHLRTPLVVVLNDNNMSIKHNVGAMSGYLSRLRTDPTLYRLRKDIERRVQKLPAIGAQMYAVGGQLKEGIKAALVPGMLFEELGFTYIGVVDGHDIEEMRANLRRAFDIGGPVLLHVRTTKGKGYGPAETKPEKFHGCGAFCVRTGTLQSGGSGAISYTEAFGRAMVELARRDDRVVGITAAMAGGTGLDHLEEALPDRFFDVGIAEEHAVTFAAGLAAAGLRPVVAMYSTFLQRAYDQLIHDVALQGLPVVFAIDRAGLVGEDGPTHHGNLDLSFLRAVPGLTIFCPKDEAELQCLLATALEMDGPSAIRYPRGAGVGVPLPPTISPLRGPGIEVLKEGRGVLVVACGTGVAKALGAATLVAEEGMEVTVANARILKPLDSDAIIQLASAHEGVVTVEENSIVGGLGAAVLEVLSDAGLNLSVARVGLPDAFVEHGRVDVLHEQVGFTSAAVAEQIRRVVEEGRPCAGDLRPMAMPSSGSMS